jgi:hypothetical protein
MLQSNERFPNSRALGALDLHECLAERSGKSF